jgi:hypothetical protein
MTNKTIQNSQAHIASEAIRACTLKATENKRMSISILDGLRTLNAQLVELDQVLKAAYGNA